MAAFKQKASHAASYGGQPLPFRSREAANLNNLGNQNVTWAPINSGKELMHAISSSADKENVKSWLDTTSPTSVLNSHVIQQHVPSEREFNPPTPSPVCSPSPSSPLSSPRLSSVELRRASPPQIAHQVSSNQNNFEAQSSVKKKIEELGSTSKRHGKDIAIEVPPDSPTGSSFSSGSEGGLLALLASKLLSYKENGKRFSRYARESSGPIDEKHVMEDRSKKPAVEEIPMVQPPPPIQEPLTSNGLYRTSSEAVSEYSLGSANGRTLSMEFDAMLAAAVATGIRQASALPDQPQQPLPEIQEDASLRVGSFGVHQHNDTGVRALVRVGASSDDEASRLTNALTVMRQDRESEDMDFNSTLSEWPLSTRSSISSGSRRGILEEHNNMQIVPTTVMPSVESSEAGSTLRNINRGSSSMSSSSCGSNGDHSLAMVLATYDHASRTASDPGESMLSSSSSSSICKDTPVPTIPARQALAKVRRDKVLAHALAFQDAKSSKCNNRYKREESKIIAWENQQKIKASIRMKKVEMRLEQKRAKALEKMQNEIALAHKRAEERKASAEAVRAAKTAKVAQLADSIRRSGKISSSTDVGCFPF